MADDVVYGLKMRDDGSVVATLSMAHRQFLVFLSERGGETDFDFSRVKPHHADHVRKLVEMRILHELPYAGTTRSLLRLSDSGRNIVTEIIRQRG